MPYLPTFTLDQENHCVTPETGREDKIELALGTWILRADTETLDGIRHYIAVPPVEDRDAISVGDLQGFGWIFRRPQNPNGRRMPLQIRSNDLLSTSGDVVSRSPIFSGKWMLTYGGSQSDVPRTFQTRLILSLNPIRYVRNNAGPRPLPVATDANWPEPFLKNCEGQPKEYGEFALDGEDNWLPNTSYYKNWANPERWQKHLRSYVQGVGNAFNAELERVRNQAGGQVDFHEDFTLQKVETAWEFAATEPIELVRNLIPHLQTYIGLNSETTHYRAEKDGKRVNSPSFKMRLGAHVELRLYAKTNRRIRFEIIQEKINHRELLGEPRIPRLHHVAQMPRPWTQIFGCLAALRVRAASKLNGVLQFLSGQTRVEPSNVSGFSLLIKIVAALENPSLAHTIVSILLGGAIVPRNGGADLLAACQRLASAGILAYDGTRRVYDITAPYQYALALLRTVPAGRIVARTRQRIRPPQN